jgi:hypothetical protein
MWSHYARNHTGVCLEFLVDDALFGHALKVDYLENYPSFTPQDANIDPTSMILAKAKDWAYEEEYRLIGTPKLPGTPIHLDGPFLHLPPGSLNAIIIGCEAKREAIEKVIKKFSPKLAIKYTKRDPNKYKLDIV